MNRARTHAGASRVVALLISLAIPLAATSTAGCKSGNGDNNNNNNNNNNAPAVSAANDDAYSGFVNYNMTVAAVDGVMANDTDANGATAASVTATTGATSQGGTYTLRADGSFDYAPPNGYSGDDTFTYMYDDGDGGAFNATVTITVAVVADTWHVDNTAAPGGDGSAALPFDEISLAETASAPGDLITIHVGDGTSTNLTAGITLKAFQHLVGQGNPKLGGTVTVAGNCLVSGLTFDSLAGTAIVGNGVNGRFDINQISVSNSAGGISLTNCSGAAILDNISSSLLTGTAMTLSSNTAFTLLMTDSSLNTATGGGLACTSGGTLTLNSVSINTNGGDGLNASNTALDLTNISITTSTGDALSISGSTITGNVMALTATGTGNGVVLSQNSGSLTIDNAQVNVTGNGVQIDSSDTTIPAGSITATTGIGLSVADSTVSLQFDNLTSTNSPAGGVDLDTVAGSVTVANLIDISGAAAAGVNIGGSSLSLAAATLSIGTCNTGLRMDSFTGAFQITTTTIADTTSHGLQITSATGATISPGATSISGTGVPLGATGHGAILVGNGGSTITFQSLSISTDNGNGLLAVGGGTVNIVSGSPTINATGGCAIDINATVGQSNGAAGWVFQSLTTSNSSTFGVSLANLTTGFTTGSTTIVNTAAAGVALFTNGPVAVSLGNGSINSTFGPAFDVDGGDAIVTYTGDITNNAERLVRVRNITGGSVTFSSGALIDNGGTGILASANSGLVSIANATIVAPLDTAVRLLNCSAVAFTSLVINTTGTPQRGFESDNVVLLTMGGINTINSGSGTALDIDQSTLGVTLQSVSSDGAPNGIVISNTTGTFVITGSGGPDSGGVIQNSTADGIMLFGASDLLFDSMRVQSPGFAGVVGVGVNNLTFANCQFKLVGQTAAADALDFGMATDNLGGLIQVNACDIDGGFRNGIRVAELAGTTVINIDNTLIRNNVGALGANNGIEIVSSGSADTTLNLTSGSALTNINGYGVHAVANGVNANHVQVFFTACSVNGAGGGLRFEVDSVNPGPEFEFTVQSSTLSTLGDAAVDLQQRNQGELRGTIGGTGSGNNLNSLDDDAIRLRASDAGKAVVLVEDNSVSDTLGDGFDSVASGATANVHITLLNNTMVVDANAISLVGGDTSAVCCNISGNNVVSGGATPGITLVSNDSCAFRVEGVPQDPPAANDVIVWMEATNTASSVCTGTFISVSGGTCELP